MSAIYQETCTGGGLMPREEADPNLIERAKHDRSAFAELYRLYLPRVYAFCQSHSQSRDEAEDLTS